MKFKLKDKLLATLGIAALTISTLSIGGTAQAKHYNNFDDEGYDSSKIKECRVLMTKKSSYEHKVYGTGEMDVCREFTSFYDSKKKKYIDWSFAMDFKDGDIYDYVYTASEGYYTRIYYFIAEDHTNSLQTNDVSITNNKLGKKDTIVVKNVQKGDIIKVYKKRNNVTYVGTPNTEITTGKAKGSSITFSVDELGAKEGKVYLSIKRGKLKESFTRMVSYNSDSYKKSKALSSSNVKVVNNKKKSDTITVNGLSKGQIVYVFDSKGNQLLKGSSKSSSIKFTIKQLSKNTGSIYVARQEVGKALSNKVKVSYKKES
ncbi:hypothetical protein [Rummeliibacillus pycnus]|uniref:hypothetical protein n=1 Tax=Rummeliibacillus pycnus TaxID=101070 RepID=UPI003D26723B